MRRVSGVRAGCPFVCGSVLELDRFWGPRLPASRQGARWLDILKVLLCARVLASTPLYRCLDKLVVHKEAFCTFLHQRWTTMFNARFDILRYDLTSTDFESDPPFEDKRQFGDSRDKRSDCVQGVIALIVTPDGFPLAYEVMPGNPSDNTTLAGFAGEERAPIRSLRSGVGHGPRHPDRSHAGHDARRRRAGALSGSRSWRSRSWARPGKRCARASRSSSSPRKGSCTCLVHSESRGLKERSMRTRRLKKLWQRLHELRRQSNRRDQLLLKLGSAKKEAGRASHLVDIRVPETGTPVTPQTFPFALRRDRLRQARRREGRDLLRSNRTGEAPATLWKYDMRLTETEQAFKALKHALAIRPIFHQREERIEAHIFVSFLAYCLLVTLQNLARPRAPGLTARVILEKFSTIQMVGIHLPTTDGRRLVLPRHPRPSHDHALLLHQLRLKLPEQPAPRLSV